MSSSRAVAAARARRAGDATTLKQSQLRNTNQQYGAGSKMNSGQSSVNQNNADTQQRRRMRVSDAIGLITLRLGRVEEIVDKVDVGGIASGLKLDSAEDTGDSGGVPSGGNAVLRSLISRIEDVEKSGAGGNESRDELDEHFKILEEHDERMQLVEKKIVSMETEMTDLKNTIYKLQGMVLDNNQKLIDMVVPKPQTSVKETTTSEKIVPTEAVAVTETDIDNKVSDIDVPDTESQLDSHNNDVSVDATSAALDQDNVVVAEPDTETTVAEESA